MSFERQTLASNQQSCGERDTIYDDVRQTRRSINIRVNSKENQSESEDYNSPNSVKNILIPETPITPRKSRDLIQRDALAIGASASVMSGLNTSWNADLDLSMGLRSSKAAYPSKQSTVYSSSQIAHVEE